MTNIVLDRLLLWQRLRALYGKLRLAGDRPLVAALLAELRIRCEVDAEDRARIPVSGPVIVVANHPFGMLEGAVLGDLLGQIRPDVKIMTNHLLEGLPELAGNCIFVDPFAGSGSAMPNSRALRQSIAWLREGGMLVTFPAGGVSHWDFGRGEVTDPRWSDTAARLIRITGASALPAYFNGANGLPFHLLGMVNPRLRTLALVQELFNKEGQTVDLRIGSAIQPQTIRAIPNDRDATQYLRWRTYLLASRGEEPVRLCPDWWTQSFTGRPGRRSPQKPIALSSPGKFSLSRRSRSWSGPETLGCSWPPRKGYRTCCGSSAGCVKSLSGRPARERGPASILTNSTRTINICSSGTTRSRRL